MWITLVILALSALFFMSGKVRSDLVAIAGGRVGGVLQLGGHHDGGVVCGRWRYFPDRAGEDD